MKSPKSTISSWSTTGTFLNDEMVTVAALKDKLQQLKTDQFNADQTDLSVVVKGADDVDYQNMVNVLDVLQQLDITKIGLATEAATTP